MEGNEKLKTCDYCGKEIAKNVYVCPHCGGKMKKPIYKRTIKGKNQTLKELQLHKKQNRLLHTPRLI